MIKIDCFLEGELGLWTLDQIPDKNIGNVLSHSREILDQAKKRGLRNPGSKALEAESKNSPLLLSVHWPSIFKPGFLARYENAYNIHQGYLPLCRGSNAAFWAMWTGCTAGATLHCIDEGVDTGDIISRQIVQFDDSTTLPELIDQIETAEQDILREFLPKMIKGEALSATPQIEFHEDASAYRLSDYVALVRDTRTNWPGMSGNDLVRLMRCTSALPIEVSGRFFNLTAQLVERK